MADAHEIRQLFAAAASELRPDEPLRLIAKTVAPLARTGEQLGQLESLLRLTFKASEPPSAALAFDWPDAANAHSVVRALEQWIDRYAATERRGVTVGVRRAAPEANGDARSHLNVHFRLGSIPDDLLELLQLAARTGLVKQVLPDIKKARIAVRRAAAAAAAPSAAPVEQPVEADPALVDAIEHNAVFDSAVHPRIDVNRTVTNTAGVTFRLITRRINGGRKRVWSKVPKPVPTGSSF